MSKREIDDTFKYHSKLGTRIDRTGTTNGSNQLATERQSERGWSKDDIKLMGYRTTHRRAAVWEREQAAQGKPVRK